MTPAMFFFFLLAVPRGLQDSQFPNQVMNPGHSSETPES